MFIFLLFRSAADTDHEIRWCMLKLAEMLYRADKEEPPKLKIHLPPTPVFEVAPDLPSASPTIKLQKMPSMPLIPSMMPSFNQRPTPPIPKPTPQVIPKLRLFPGQSPRSAGQLLLYQRLNIMLTFCCSSSFSASTLGVTCDGAFTVVNGSYTKICHFPRSRIITKANQVEEAQTPGRRFPSQQASSYEQSGFCALQDHFEHAESKQPRSIFQTPSRSCSRRCGKVSFDLLPGSLFVRLIYYFSYLDVIRHPMDLSTMKAKLDANMYPDRRSFRADFKLMVSNAKAYNLPGTFVYKEAETLNVLFDDSKQTLEIISLRIILTAFRLRMGKGGSL